MEFKSTKQTDAKLNDVAKFLDKQIDKLNTEIEKDYFCDNCESELGESDLGWLNDQPICLKCETFINI